MDTSAAGISFDENGVCNFCRRFLDRSSNVIFKSAEEKQDSLNSLVEAVKKNGRNRRYDCVVGVSGGVDSSWVLVKAVELGLRPLAVHMDNGWNSELAQNNIANLVNGLGVDLYTHVINWEEYRGLMQSFFDADVIDIELLYDNAMLAVNYQQAAANGVRHILGGTNQATEGMDMPQEWNWFKYDAKNIKEISRKFGGPSLRTFPHFGTLSYLWYVKIRGIEWVSFLDFLDFNKFDAVEVLKAKYNYKPYPYKHYESVFTRFYQGFILPTKFGVDKRRLHLSTLIISRQLSREEALESLAQIAYPSERELENDRRYFLKKMNWTDDQLEAYLKRPEVKHDRYPSEKAFYEACISFKQKLRGRRS